MHRFFPRHFACFLLSLSTVYALAQSQQIPQASLPDSPDVVYMQTSAINSGDTRGYATSKESSSNESAWNDSGAIQQTNQTNTPSSTTTPASPDNEQIHQTKRILGIIPNFRAVSANQVLPPQSAKEKFLTATEDSFDYSAVLLPVVLAGYSMATDATPEFHQGVAGYGRYLWHTAADQSIENYAVEFIVPAATHEDIRYYTMGKGGFLKRAGYALSRAVVTRTDSGGESFNFAEVVGAGAAAGISDLYYPPRTRTFGNTTQKWGVNVGIDAATFVCKEFWPDINHALFHSKY